MPLLTTETFYYGKFCKQLVTTCFDIKILLIKQVKTQLFSF